MVMVGSPAMSGVAYASNNPHTEPEHVPVNICHATGSDTNPYEFKTVDDDSTDFQGHLSHRNDPNKVWKNDIFENGAYHPAGSPKSDIIQSYTDSQGVFHSYDGDVTEATCSPTIQQPAFITIKKLVDGGTAVPGDFTMHISGVTAVSNDFAGSSIGKTVEVQPGTYSVNELNPGIYHEALSVGCSGTLAEGATAACTVTNTFVPEVVIPEHSLTVIKNVVGGEAQSSDFQMHVKQGGSDINGSPQNGSTTGNVYNALEGDYAVSETSTTVDLSDYQVAFSDDCDAQGNVNVSETDETCTVTNTFIGGQGGVEPGTLIVKKHVINDDGGKKTASDFTMSVGGANVSDSSFNGSEDGVSVTLDAGSYSVSEGSHTGYTETVGEGCLGTIEPGQTVTCTITNDDIASVDNNGGDNPGQGSTPDGAVLGASTTPATLPATGAEANLPWMASLLGAMAAYWISRRREGLTEK
jgi:hypothetical protein